MVIINQRLSMAKHVGILAPPGHAAALFAVCRSFYSYCLPPGLSVLCNGSLLQREAVVRCTACLSRANAGFDK